MDPELVEYYPQIKVFILGVIETLGPKFVDNEEFRFDIVKGINKITGQPKILDLIEIFTAIESDLKEQEKLAREKNPEFTDTRIEALINIGNYLANPDKDTYEGSEPKA